MFFIYAGLTAGFFLIYSMVWKKFKNPEDIEKLLHPLALIISAIIVLFLFRTNYLLLLAGIYLIAAVLAFHYSRNGNKRDGAKELYAIYILLFLAWIANVVAFLIIKISLETGMTLYSISSILFLIMVYRVVNKTSMKNEQKTR